MPNGVNDLLVLVGGKSTTGKSWSLQHMRNPEGVMYLNCESGKRLPFKSKFKEATVIDPLQVFGAFDAAEKDDSIHTIVIDTLTFLMDMYETRYIVPAKDGREAWGNFAQYFKSMMQQYVAKSTKTVLFLAHTKDTLNEGEMVMETAVPIKGSLKNQGVEAYFSCIVAAKRVSINALKEYQSDLLTITPMEEKLKFKHVFQTQLTADTVNERIRGPMGLWTPEETFIDNDMQLVVDRLIEYYK